MLRSAVGRAARRVVPEKENLLTMLRGPRPNNAAAQSAEAKTVGDGDKKEKVTELVKRFVQEEKKNMDQKSRTRGQDH